MLSNYSDRINQCLKRIADLRARAAAETDLAERVELRRLEEQWLAVLDSYQMVSEAKRYLSDIHVGRSPFQTLPISRYSGHGPSLAELLQVLVLVAVEHARGEARAAFYLADREVTKLHHVTGMTEAYAGYVNGLAIGEQSLACGLAVAKRTAVITPDVSKEPRWKPWLWLAEQFQYRACWSFPIVSSSNRVLGSFAIYYPEYQDATASDLDLAAVLTRTAATIIMQLEPASAR